MASELNITARRTLGPQVPTTVSRLHLEITCQFVARRGAKQGLRGIITTDLNYIAIVTAYASLRKTLDYLAYLQHVWQYHASNAPSIGYYCRSTTTRFTCISSTSGLNNKCPQWALPFFAHSFLNSEKIKSAP